MPKSVINLRGFRLVLGSGSRGRGEVLEKANIQFARMSAEINEDGIGDRSSLEGIRSLPLLIACAKRDALIPRFAAGTRKILVTVDSIVIHGCTIREKPRDEAEFREWLEHYAASVADVELLNGMTVTNLRTGVSVTGAHSSFMTLKVIKPDAIKKFLKVREFYDSSGGIVHEHPLWVAHTKHIRNGRDSIIGMPLGLLGELVEKAFEPATVQSEEPVPV